VARLDYSRRDVARGYADGRALSDAALARWGAAVSPWLPNRPTLEVLDVGAGSGIFARAWPRWARCRVSALEPATAMRDEMLRTGVPDAVRVIGGRAEALPLRAATVDVAWLSTVIHHLTDLSRCVAELGRVVAPGGVVLVRGLFADLGLPRSVQSLPGWRRAVSTFPSISSVHAAMSEAGFGVLVTAEVQDNGPTTVGRVADRVRRLRHVDTLLGQFTDQEIAEGLSAMDRVDARQIVEPSTLGLIAYGRP
jgi:ubiquinone/menaquinone biosynthesis C-methylase UbiE